MFRKRGILLLVLLAFILINIRSINSGYCPDYCGCYDGQYCSNSYYDYYYGWVCSGVGISCGTDGCSGGQYVDYYCSVNYCYSQYLERDGSSTYCSCLGSSLWAIGGEVAATTCCSDDPGEHKLARNCNSWCTSDGSDDACCNANNKCVYSSTCYNSGSCYSNKAYCSLGTWYDPDSNPIYCAPCVGGGCWALGGEVAATTCCEDDTGEFRITEASSTDAPSPYNGDTGTTCCNPSTDCTESGTDTCTAFGSAAGTIPNRAYCGASNTWYGGDAGGAQCSAIVGGEGYYQIGGEAGNNQCCGDDTGEYKIIETSGTDAPSPYNGDTGTTCCNPSTDCTESGTDTCTAFGSAAGTIPNRAYCGASNTWYGGDAGGAQCTIIVGGIDYWNLGGEVAASNCCGDDNGEYKITQGIGGTLGGKACCDKSGDCIDKSNRCQSEYGKETTASCKDGFDNDCDGETDCSDPNCTSVCLPDCTPEVCTGGIDEDCDHYTDCADNDCTGDPACETCSQGSPSKTEICDNGKDDDCDGKIDCADNDCIGDPACETCSGGSPSKTEICDNGKDDDCDTFIDNGDWDCPGCLKGTALCDDGKTCDSWCASKTGGVQGCIAENDKCEEGEGCACADCKNKRDCCEKGTTCDTIQQLCSCPANTQICPDGSCKESCNVCGNDDLEPGEECDGTDFGGNTCPTGCTGSLTCTLDCKISTSSCSSCPGCTVTNGDRVCCVIDGDGVCDSDCTADADPDCASCKPNKLGDCCDDKAGNGCDPDCIPYKDPDCSTSCTSEKDNCCKVADGDGCDPDCNQGVDPDCGTCTTATDCCDDKEGNDCDKDCIPGVDPDCKCGNLAIDNGETCDRTNLDEKTCSDFEFDSGLLSCFEPRTEDECHFDTSGCYGAFCVDENGECETGEDCRCPDCLGKQAMCGFNQVCDGTARCKCKDGTTFCVEGCALPADCQTFPECYGDGVCEIGEGCSCSSGSGCVNNICNDCEGKTDTCASSSTCVNGMCTTCSIKKAYWSEDCIGSDVTDGVSMVVEGTKGCKGKTVTLDLKEQDSGIESGEDDNVETLSATFDDKGKAELKWTPLWRNRDTDWNDCVPLLGCDAEKYSGNPPDSFLEYYFKAKVGEEEMISEVLNVHYCVPECDDDCDTFVDADKQSKPVCQALKNTEYPSKTGEGNLKIDSNPKSEHCEDCTPEGLSPGQETCAAYYDCTPDWWTKPGETKEPDQNHGESLLDINFVLGWSEECDEQSGRTRKICHESYSEDDCCKDQAHCYCKWPNPNEIPEVKGLNCEDKAYRPPKVKACLAEEKFPFFTNMNILIVVLILTGFYIWKNRNQEKARIKR